MTIPEEWKGFYKLFQRHQQLGLTASAVTDAKTRRLILREQNTLGRELAKMLGAPGDGCKVVPLPAPLEGAIKPVLRVSGLPSKKGRAQIKAWMTQNDISWDGSMTMLRSVIDNAVRGDGIPNGRFDGLRVEWVIEVDTSTYWKTMMAFSMAERGTVPAPLTLRPPRS